MMTQVDVSGLPPRRAVRLDAEARVAAAVGALSSPVTRARVFFTDVNGDKGGIDIRCAITVSLRGRRRLHVEDMATTPREALDKALAKLERRVLRTEEVDRDNRRRPKKYYAAARLADRRA